MENSTPPELLMAELAKALQEWRDALVNVSLALQDYQFECEENCRPEIVQTAQNLVERTRGPAKHSRGA